MKLFRLRSKHSPTATAAVVQNNITLSKASTTMHTPQSIFRRVVAHLRLRKEAKPLDHRSTSLNADEPSQEESSPQRGIVRASSHPAAAQQTSEAVQVDENLYWGPIFSIPTYKVRELVLRILGSQIDSQCWVTETTQGSFNHVFIVQFRNETKVCLKIPATGWEKRWSLENAAELRREALTLRFIHKKLGGTFPCPDLYAYDTTMDNEIGAPFILMTFLPGKPAQETWYKTVQDDQGRVDFFGLADRRTKVLESLAQHMVKLRTITFPAIGVLDFSNDDCGNPHIVPEMSSITDYSDDQNPERPYPMVWTQHQTCRNTLDFFHDMAPDMDRLDDTGNMVQRKIIACARTALPDSRDISFSFNPRLMKEETFSLAHNDLDLQNVLCDEEGNVTGILDWEGVKVRPHFLGWCSTPMWIREDCNAGKGWPFDRDVWHSPVTMQKWRCQYFTAMNKAIGYRDDLSEYEEDALPKNYIAMSHFGHALYDGLRNRHTIPRKLEHFCDMMIQMMFPNKPLDVVYENLASWRSGANLGWDRRLPMLDEGEIRLIDWIKLRLHSIMNYGRPNEWNWTALTVKKSASTNENMGDDSLMDEDNSSYTEDLWRLFDNDTDDHEDEAHSESQHTIPHWRTGSSSSKSRSLDSSNSANSDDIDNIDSTDNTDNTDSTDSDCHSSALSISTEATDPDLLPEPPLLTRNTGCSNLLEALGSEQDMEDVIMEGRVFLPAHGPLDNRRKMTVWEWKSASG